MLFVMSLNNCRGPSKVQHSHPSLRQYERARSSSLWLQRYIHNVMLFVTVLFSFGLLPLAGEATRPV